MWEGGRALDGEHGHDHDHDCDGDCDDRLHVLEGRSILDVSDCDDGLHVREGGRTLGV